MIAFEPEDRIRVEVKHPETGEILTAYLQVLADNDGALGWLLEHACGHRIERATYETIYPKEA